MSMPYPEFMTPRELADLISMSLAFVEKYTALRRIPGMVKMGRFWRYRKADVEKQLLTGQILLPAKHRQTGWSGGKR